LALYAAIYTEQRSTDAAIGSRAGLTIVDMRPRVCSARACWSAFEQRGLRGRLPRCTTCTASSSTSCATRAARAPYDDGRVVVKCAAQASASLEWARAKPSFRSWQPGAYRLAGPAGPDDGIGNAPRQLRTNADVTLLEAGALFEKAPAFSTLQQTLGGVSPISTVHVIRFRITRRRLLCAERP
jgi:hypothetical protein